MSSTQVIIANSSVQTSVANKDILASFKPVNCASFIVNYLDIYPTTECHVVINGTTTMHIPDNGFAFNSMYEISSLAIVEAGITYEISGVANAIITDSNTSSSGIGTYEDVAGVLALPRQVNLTTSGVQNITTYLVRSGLSANITNPSGLVFSSNNTAVATVSNSGTISYVGAGTTDIIVSYSGKSNVYDFIQVTCS
jgi:hypothetical protein